MNKDVTMNSPRRQLAAILGALGVPPSARRPAAIPAAPACKSLEGRQLLASGMGLAALGGPGSGGPADVSATSGSFTISSADWGSPAGSFVSHGSFDPGLGAASSSPGVS